MCVTIQAKPVTCDELANLLEDLHGKEPQASSEARACESGGTFRYLIAADWREIYFVGFDHRSQINLSDSDSGRAFGENAELRWRRCEDGDRFLCRWIADDETSPAGEGWQPLPQAELEALEASEKIQHLLWGEPLWLPERDEPFWYQARIPRKLTYPIDKELADQWKPGSQDRDTPLVLYVREYQQNGQTLFERFIGLDKYESDNKEGKS